MKMSRSIPVAVLPLLFAQLLGCDSEGSRGRGAADSGQPLEQYDMQHDPSEYDLSLEVVGQIGFSGSLKREEFISRYGLPTQPIRTGLPYFSYALSDGSTLVMLFDIKGPHYPLVLAYIDYKEGRDLLYKAPSHENVLHVDVPQK